MYIYMGVSHNISPKSVLKLMHAAPDEERRPKRDPTPA